MRPKLSSPSSSEKPAGGSFDSPLEAHRSSEGTKAGAPRRFQRADADCHNGVTESVTIKSHREDQDTTGRDPIIDAYSRHGGDVEVS